MDVTRGIEIITRIFVRERNNYENFETKEIPAHK